MGNSIGADILVQTPNPQQAALFYVNQLGFEVTDMAPDLISLHGQSINLFIEKGPSLGPVLEITVPDVDAAKKRLLANGCEILKDEPNVPRAYLRDPYGLVYNLASGRS